MNRELYFYRNVIFSKKGKKVSLIDFNNPEKGGEELDDWFGMVLQLADGQHTIEELCQFMSTKYNEGTVPENLDATLISVISRMMENKFIILTENATELPYYMSMPYEMLDLEKAKEEMKKDGGDLI